MEEFKAETFYGVSEYQNGVKVAIYICDQKDVELVADVLANGGTLPAMTIQRVVTWPSAYANSATRDDLEN